MDEPLASNYKIGDRIVATASELNGHMGTIKFIGQVIFYFSLPHF